MAPWACFLYAPRVTHRSGLLCIASPDRLIYASRIPASRPLKIPCPLPHLFYGLVASNVSTGQRPFLDSGNRVAVLYASAPDCPGNCPRGEPRSHPKTLTRSYIQPSRAHRLGFICTFLGFLLFESPLGDLPGPTFNPQRHLVLFIWHYRQIHRRFCRWYAYQPLLYLFATSLD